MASKRTWIPRRRATLETWISDVKGRMGLEDWTISVDWDGNEHTHPLTGEHPSALATMTPMPSSKHATMAVSRELLDIPAPLRHQALVHEMVHCHLFAIHEHAKEGFAAAAKKNKLARKVFNAGLNQQIETATDALADALAELLPEAHLE